MPPELTEAEMQHLAEHHPDKLTRYAELLEQYAGNEEEVADLHSARPLEYTKLGLAMMRRGASRRSLVYWTNHCRRLAQGVT